MTLTRAALRQNVTDNLILNVSAEGEHGSVLERLSYQVGELQYVVPSSSHQAIFDAKLRTASTAVPAVPSYLLHPLVLNNSAGMSDLIISRAAVLMSLIIVLLARRV